jgi:hypothetical protein
MTQLECVIISRLRLLESSLQFSGDFVERVTPVPIPNTEVKPLRADDTAPFRCGKVGSRRIYILIKSLLLI